MKFRKKPVEIEAWQWSPKVKAADIPKWMMNRPYDIVGDCLVIETLEGTMRARVGDWIIKGVKDEIYPCKPDIFAATYEPVYWEQSADGQDTIRER